VDTAAVAVAAVMAVAVAIATRPLGISWWGPAEPDPTFLILVSIAGVSAMKEEHIELEGRVTTVLPGTMFRVELDNKHLVLATICGKMRKRWVRLTVGDRVKMEMSPYDLDKARITWRLR
jgi:translation initiation factor IF-1